MKKLKFLAAFAIVAIAAVAVANKLNTHQNQMSELMLANVEALAEGEVVVESECWQNPDEVCHYPAYPEAGIPEESIVGSFTTAKA